MIQVRLRDRMAMAGHSKKEEHTALGHGNDQGFTKTDLATGMRGRSILVVRRNWKS